MDIVQKLRLRPECERLYIDGGVAVGTAPTIEAQAADEIERLRNRISTGDGTLRTIVDERDSLRRERDEWLDRCTDAQASADIARKERDAVVSIAQYDSDEAEKLKSDLAAARALLQEMRDARFLAWQSSPEGRAYLARIDAALFGEWSFSHDRD